MWWNSEKHKTVEIRADGNDAQNQGNAEPKKEDSGTKSSEEKDRQKVSFFANDARFYLKSLLLAFRDVWTSMDVDSGDSPAPPSPHFHCEKSPGNAQPPIVDEILGKWGGPARPEVHAVTASASTESNADNESGTKPKPDVYSDRDSLKTEDLWLLLVIDEVHAIGLPSAERIESMHRAMNTLRILPAFLVTLSTQSDMRFLAPPTHLQKSARMIEAAATLNSPLAVFPFDCFVEQTWRASRMDLNLLEQPMYLALYGRPL